MRAKRPLFGWGHVVLLASAGGFVVLGRWGWAALCAAIVACDLLMRLHMRLYLESPRPDAPRIDVTEDVRASAAARHAAAWAAQGQPPPVPGTTTEHLRLVGHVQVGYGKAVQEGDPMVTMTLWAVSEGNPATVCVEPALARHTARQLLEAADRAEGAS